MATAWIFVSVTELVAVRSTTVLSVKRGFALHDWLVEEPPAIHQKWTTFWTNVLPQKSTAQIVLETRRLRKALAVA